MIGSHLFPLLVTCGQRVHWWGIPVSRGSQTCGQIDTQRKAEQAAKHCNKTPPSTIPATVRLQGPGPRSSLGLECSSSEMCTDTTSFRCHPDSALSVEFSPATFGEVTTPLPPPHHTSWRLHWAVVFFRGVSYLLTCFISGSFVSRLPSLAAQSTSCMEAEALCAFARCFSSVSMAGPDTYYRPSTSIC